MEELIQHELINDQLINDMITGEQLQELADVYIGLESDFNWNPRISRQVSKQMINIPDNYDNPRIIFCYGHRLRYLLNRLSKFNNRFFLIVHNSDENIGQFIVEQLFNSQKVIHLFSQNLIVDSRLNDFVTILPIGIANSQFEHGNLQLFKNIDLTKSENVFMNFEVATNMSKRIVCLQQLTSKGIPFLAKITPGDNLKRMAKYRFVICPEGNGVDTHRIWEAIYLKCIPVVLNNLFTRRLSNVIPLVVLDNWSNLELSLLSESTYKQMMNNYNPETPEVSKMSFYTPLRTLHGLHVVNYVLVMLNNFNDYILDNLKHLLKTVKGTIYLITNREFFKLITITSDRLILVCSEELESDKLVHNYIQNSKLDPSFRNGFWVLTSLRFFYINAFMKKYNITNVVHIENDVVIYYDFNFKQLDNYIWIPFDTFDRNIASIVYIPSCTILTNFLQNYDTTKTDMDNFKRELGYTVKNFPIIHQQSIPFLSNNFETFNCIFDAAAIGQYLGGIDPKNLPINQPSINQQPTYQPFINETCLIKYDKYNIQMIDNKPFIVEGDQTIPIFNLHIHSKNVKSFTNPNLTILVESWVYLLHSYSTVIVEQIVSMVNKGHTVYVSEVDYFNPSWTADTSFSLWPDHIKVALTKVNTYTKNTPVDIIYRASYPFNITKNTTIKNNTGKFAPVCVFYTTELEKVTKDNIIGDCFEHYFTGPSKWSVQGLENVIPPERNIVISHGIDPKIFRRDHSKREQIRNFYHIAQDEILLFHLGALTPNKGIHYILQALYILNKRQPKKYKLLIKASGFLYDSKKFIDHIINGLVSSSLISEHDMTALVNDNIVFIDEKLDYSSINNLYNACDYYISPYVAEGFNLPVLEALAAGTRVVIPRTGSTSDFIDGISNLFPNFVVLVDSNVVKDETHYRNDINLDDLINKLELNVNQPTSSLDSELLSTYVAETFNWDLITDTLIKYFKTIIC